MKAAFLFPGQGSQFVGMGRDLARAFPEARQLLERADEVLEFPLSRLMAEGPEEELRQTVHTQPAVVAHSLAALAVLRARGVEAVVAAGHSVGEYAAVVACGAWEVEVALELVHRRGRYMHEAGPGAMAALLGADIGEAEALCTACTGTVEVANLNGPGQVVISGSVEGIEEALARAREFGIRRVVRLPVSGAFHSSMMRPAAERLAADLEKAPLRPPRLPIVVNRTARPVTDPEELRQALKEQIVSRVLWEDSVRTMLDLGVEVFLEVGPGHALCGMVRRISREARVLPAGDRESMDRALAAVALRV